MCIRDRISVLPLNVGADESSQSQWADITIATPTDDSSGSSGGLPLTEIGIIVVLLGWAAYFGSIIRKRRS